MVDIKVLEKELEEKVREVVGLSNEVHIQVRKLVRGSDSQFVVSLTDGLDRRELCAGQDLRSAVSQVLPIVQDDSFLTDFAAEDPIFYETAIGDPPEAEELDIELAVDDEEILEQKAEASKDILGAIDELITVLANDGEEINRRRVASALLLLCRETGAEEALLEHPILKRYYARGIRVV